MRAATSCCCYAAGHDQNQNQGTIKSPQDAAVALTIKVSQLREALLTVLHQIKKQEATTPGRYQVPRSRKKDHGFSFQRRQHMLIIPTAGSQRRPFLHGFTGHYRRAGGVAVSVGIISKCTAAAGNGDEGKGGGHN